MADIVMAYAASHAIMTTADRVSGSQDQTDSLFGGLRCIRERAARSPLEAVVMITGEFFTNFLLYALPQIMIGIGEAHQRPPYKWLKLPGTVVPGEPGLARHILDRTVAAGFQPALSYRMKADHGFVAQYCGLDPLMRLPMVPIIINCTTTPLMTFRQCYEFGRAVGDAMRSYSGLRRVALCAAGGLPHFMGSPRIAEVDEEFDRWFVKQFEQNDLGELLDLPNNKLMEAGTGGVRTWVALAGAMCGHSGATYSYQPICQWINGMGLLMYNDGQSSSG